MLLALSKSNHDSGSHKICSLVRNRYYSNILHGTSPPRTWIKIYSYEKYYNGTVVSAKRSLHLGCGDKQALTEKEGRGRDP